MTKAQPGKVVLSSGGSAFVLIAKATCTLGNQAAAVTIKLTLSGQPSAVLAGPVASPGSGGDAGLDYCKGGPKDPDQAVGVSPIEATGNAAGPFTG